MWAIILIFVVAIIFAIVQLNNDKEARKSDTNTQNIWLENNNIKADVDYKYESSTHDISVRYIVDSFKKEVLVSDTSEKFITIPFSEIIGCEILEDSEVAGGIGRAVVGGLLAGGAGAIVGANTAKKHIQSYKVVIYRENINTPQTILTLIKTKESTKNSINYSGSVEFARKVNASIKAIIALTEPRKDSVVESDSLETTAKNKLIELKELLDLGLINEEEYNTKRVEFLKSGSLSIVGVKSVK